MGYTSQRSEFCAPVSPWLPYFLNLFSLFAASAILLYVVADNAPVIPSLTIPVDQVNTKPWLFTLNMTDAATTATTILAGDGKLRKIGFGVWGYCEWDWSQTLGNADCHSKPLWKVEYSEDHSDTAQYVNLPGAISQNLSGAAVCLVVALAFTLTMFIPMAWSMYYPHPSYPLKFGDNSKMRQQGNSRVGAAILVQNGYWQIFINLIILILIIPTLACVGIGTSAYNGKVGWEAKAGIGFNLLLGVIGLLTFAFCLMMFPKNGAVFKNRNVTQRTANSSGAPKGGV